MSEGKNNYLPDSDFALLWRLAAAEAADPAELAELARLESER